MEVDGKHNIWVEDICRVGRDNEIVCVNKQSLKNVAKTRLVIDELVKNKKIVYGITTGFGAFKNIFIEQDDLKQLQENLILSHAVGVGAFLEKEIVRSIMFLMVNYLSKGFSGVRPIVIETLIQLLNNDIVPMVPEQGSVGSSGDLVPSAHIVLALIGKGDVLFQNRVVNSLTAFKKCNIVPLVLDAKEGLALINNTATLSAIGSLAVKDAYVIANIADIAAGLSAEALRATDKAFAKNLHQVKPYSGQILVAKNLRRYLKNSVMIDRSRIQDQYSIRCVPQIHGGVREALKYVSSVVNVEINSITDNPLVFLTKEGTEIISGGNFHGEAMAIAMDTMGIAMSEFANVSDRRIASLLDPSTNNGLPAFLTECGGLNSGFMIAQYTTASLVSENKVYAHPSSVDSIPTSANVEDLVSMGNFGSRKARKIIENVKKVLAIEIIVACQAIDFRKKEGFRLGTVNEKIYQKVRNVVPYFPKDIVYNLYIGKVVDLFEILTSI